MMIYTTFPTNFKRLEFFFLFYFLPFNTLSIALLWMSDLNLSKLKYFLSASNSSSSLIPLIFVSENFLILNQNKTKLAEFLPVFRTPRRSLLNVSSRKEKVKLNRRC